MKLLNNQEEQIKTEPMKPNDYEKILNYARENLLYDAVRCLIRYKKYFVGETVKLKTLITATRLKRMGCHCFLIAIRFMRTKKKPDWYDDRINFEKEFSLFDINKLLLNGDNDISATNTDCLSRSEIKFNFDYIQSIVDQQATKYGYQKYSRQEIDQANFLIDCNTAKLPCIICMGGNEGAGSHYEIVDFVDALTSSSMTRVYLPEQIKLL